MWLEQLKQQLITQVAEASGQYQWSCYQQDITWLLQHVLHIPANQQLAHKQHWLATSDLVRIRQAVQRYISGTPLAYIVRHTEFMGISFSVDERVLIPRNDTESLVHWLLLWIAQQQHRHFKVLELGTGSGCIAISLARLAETTTALVDIVATDIALDALQVAKNNAAQLLTPSQNSRLQFLQGYWFTPLQQTQKFDIIVSNPPYIDASCNDYDVSILQEPQQALFAKNHGLADLQHIVQQAPAYLKVGGVLCLEHGFNQDQYVRERMHQQGLQNIVTHEDLARHPRFTVGFL